MNRSLTICASFVGFASVALGAFGAHGLEGKLSPQAIDWWETATFYALPHAIGALAIAMSGRAGLIAAAWAFVVGAVIFAGSLYAMALLSMTGDFSFLGAITPIGGLALLIGWGMIFLHGLRSRKA